MPLPTFKEPCDTMDYIDMANMSYDLKLTLSSLKAIVNAEKPRIFTNDGTEDYNNWLKDLKINYEVYTDPYELIKKYKDEIESLILYDVENKHTVNWPALQQGYTNP